MAEPSLIIKSSIKKLAWLLLVLGTLFLVAACAQPPAAAWIGTIVLGPLFLIALYIYRPAANYLHLHSTGLDIFIAGRKRTVLWADVAGFHTGMNRKDRQIGILYSAQYIARAGADSPQAPDADGEWIRDLYVLPLDELCRTLNAWNEDKSAIARCAAEPSAQ